MTYKLFLDDERFPVDDSWVIVRSYDEAVSYVKEHGMPSFISWDHDLGDKSLTGHDFAKWLVDYDLDNDLITKDFSFYVHSANPVGAANIKNLLDSYLSYKQLN